MGNSIGKLFRISSFGESHGKLIGILVEGCPAGLDLSEAEIQTDLNRRKPASIASTTRLEDDRVEILSGVMHQQTTGAPIAMVVYNRQYDSRTYGERMEVPRPGHADYPAGIKYGGFADHRGGGRFSGRITAGFVMAGVIAKKLLSYLDIEVLAHTTQIGGVKSSTIEITAIRHISERSPLHCADREAEVDMLSAIEQAASCGDSLGGTIEIIATNLPVGLGEPVFDRLDGQLAKALFAIPAVKAVEFGAGAASAGMKGSENNDPYAIHQNRISTASNHCGGVLGGLSNGMPLIARIAIKPTPSIAIPQDSVDLAAMRPAKLEIKGRHDVCIVPRAVVVAEAMTAIVLADFALRAQLIPGVLK